MDDRRGEALSHELRTLSSAAAQVSSARDGNGRSSDAGPRHAYGRRHEVHSLLCDSLMRKLMHLALIGWALASAGRSQPAGQVQPRVIELTAGRDSRYREGRKVYPTVEAGAGGE